MKRAHWIQHVPFEGLGRIETWLAANGWSITGTRMQVPAATLPPLSTVDFLVVMGGPMSANDEATLPWLAPEKRFIADAIAAGKPVLGVCLGAQLIAAALGARVYRNAEREIGWWPIRSESPDFPASIDVFHWHGETFDLPAGARLLASSPGCRNQAFAFGTHVLGLQFHLEMTPEGARALVDRCPGDLAPGRYVQSPEGITEAPIPAYAAPADLLDRLLVRLLNKRA